MTGKFEIFRDADARTLSEAGALTVTPMSTDRQVGLEAMHAAGVREGEEIRVLVDLPGFSLIHVWFKSGYPLPLHAHDIDCLYHVVAGTLQLGSESLGARDSFFIPANTPYTYKIGSEGVELLEIRHQGRTSITALSKGAFFEKALASIGSHRKQWKRERRPSEPDPTNLPR